MEALQKYGVIVVLAALGIFFIIERFFPLRQPSRSLLHRLMVNGAMSVLTLATAFVLVRPVALWTQNWTNENGFGLLNMWAMPAWMSGILGFLLLDLSYYYWHRLNHRVPFLWRFHNVHHFDPDLDASTGFRFHFGEVALSTVFRGVQMLAIGVSLPVFILYEFVFQVGTYFHHSNIQLPRPIDQSLNLLVVTPRMHGIHHSSVHDETDSNYSVVFSIWDRLHRTFRAGIPQSEIVIGVPGYYSPEDNHISNAILAPFRSQKDYWQGREHRSQHKAMDLRTN